MEKEAIAASAARAQGEARLNASRRRKLKPHEWFVASVADYARLANQVGTLWHERGDVDAYYLDGAVFVCKKRRVHGDFEVLDVFSTDVSYEEFESRRRRAHEEVVYADAGDYSSFTRRLRNALGRDNGGADGVENGRAAADSGLGAGGLGGSEEASSDAGRSDAGDVVHTADGQVFAYRVGGAYGKEHYAKDAAARGLSFKREAEREARGARGGDKVLRDGDGVVYGYWDEARGELHLKRISRTSTRLCTSGRTCG